MIRSAVHGVWVLAALVGCSRPNDEHAHANPAPARRARAELAVTTTCGGRGNDCPLQSWMKANATTAIASSDFERLEHAFDRIVALDPSERDYPRWGTIARDGASAARSKDIEGVRLSCKQCHDAYRERYRLDRRSAPLE